MATTKLIWETGDTQGVLKDGELFSAYTGVFMNSTTDTTKPDLDTLFPVAFLRQTSKWIYIKDDRTFARPPDSTSTLTQIWGFKSESGVTAVSLAPPVRVFLWVTGTAPITAPAMPTAQTYQTTWSSVEPVTPSISGGQTAILYVSDITSSTEGAFQSATAPAVQRTISAQTYYRWVTNIGSEPIAPNTPTSLAGWNVSQPVAPSIGDNEYRALYQSTITVRGSNILHATQPILVANTVGRVVRYYRRRNGAQYSTAYATPTSGTLSDWSTSIPPHTFVATAAGQGTAVYQSDVVVSATNTFVSAGAVSITRTNAALVYWRWTTGTLNPPVNPAEPQPSATGWTGPFTGVNVNNAPAPPSLQAGQNAQLWRGIWITEQGVITQNANTVISQGVAIIPDALQRENNVNLLRENGSILRGGLTDLSTLAVADDGDLLIIVDTSATQTKQITVANLRESISDIVTGLNALTGDARIDYNSLRNTPEN